MGWVYAFFKCADKSVKGIPALRKLQALETKFSLKDLDDFFVRERIPGTSADFLFDNSSEEEFNEAMARFNQVKKGLLHQIIPICICTEYYDVEPNNALSRHYFDHALEAADGALTRSQYDLERVLKEDETDYDTSKATSLTIRYAITRGLLKLKAPSDSLVKKIFIICPVRDATPEEQEFLLNYVKEQEAKGHKVHYPPRDTDQLWDPIGIRICTDNKNAIRDADEVHIYWNTRSSGSGFDLGMTFMLGKPIKLINKDQVPKTDGKKSFNNVLNALHEMYDLD